MPGAGFWDTSVAPRDRGGQGDGAGSLSRVFAAAHPCQTAHGRFTNRPYRGAGGGARGSVPHVGEGSTAVRMVQEGWRKCGIGADWWGEMAQTWGLMGRARGWMGQGGERVAREGDAFFGVLGSEWAGCGRGCAAGVCWDVRGTLAEQYGERKAMAVGSELGAGAGCSRERRFWARLVICNRLERRCRNVC